MKKQKVVLMLLCSASLIPGARGQQEVPAAAGTPQASALLRPGLAALSDSLQSVRVDRWKVSQATRDEVQTNIASIHRDLDTTLPALLTAADAKPASLVSALPVSRNVDALYDVLLRTLERARAAGPTDQAASLERARVSLDQARRDFDTVLQGNAAAQEVALLKARSVSAAAPPACVPAPVKKRKLKS